MTPFPIEIDKPLAFAFSGRMFSRLQLIYVGGDESESVPVI